MSGNNGCPNDENDFERGYEAGVRYEHERIERLIMGHDPIEPSDRAYLLKLIKRK